MGRPGGGCRVIVSADVLAQATAPQVALWHRSAFLALSWFKVRSKWLVSIRRKLNLCCPVAWHSSVWAEHSRKCSAVCLCGDEFVARKVGAGRKENAAAVSWELRRPEASVLVHRFDGHGHPVVSGADASAGRHLPLHHGPVPLLPEEHAALAEFVASQFVVQRLLPQGATPAGSARKGSLLDAASARYQHVRKRVPAPPPEAVQVAQSWQGTSRKRIGRPQQHEPDHQSEFRRSCRSYNSKFRYDGSCSGAGIANQHALVAGLYSAADGSRFSSGSSVVSAHSVRSGWRIRLQSGGCGCCCGCSSARISSLGSRRGSSVGLPRRILVAGPPSVADQCGVWILASGTGIGLQA